MSQLTDSRAYRSIPGWFESDDCAMFRALMRSQADLHGDLVELGAYQGRSAVVIGEHLRPGERFFVIDLFGSDLPSGRGGADEANRRENSNEYPTLSQKQFETNYLKVHLRLPEVIRDFSSVLPRHVAERSVRFMHIDASHMYDRVAEDIVNARRVMLSDGVVALDDFRAAHTPGVAAATWEAVRTHGMVPFAITGAKLYATWTDPRFYRDCVHRMLRDQLRYRHEEQEVMGHKLTRIVLPRLHSLTRGARWAADPWAHRLRALPGQRTR